MARASVKRQVVWAYYDDKGIDDPRFRYFKLPTRGSFWPPVRQSIRFSRKIRSFLIKKSIKSAYGIGPGDTVISCLDGANPFYLAADIAQLSGARLVLFLHDMWPRAHINLENDIRYVLPRCDVVMAVSDALRDTALQHGAKTAHTLFPIGEDFLDVNLKKLSGQFTVGVAGSTSQSAIALAASLGDDVVALSPPIEMGDASAPVRFIPRFPRNEDALRLVAEQCSIFLVHIPVHLEDYGTFGFPSKLVDFAQTGMPILIIAAPETSVSRWAHSVNWPLIFTEDDILNRTAEIRHIIRQRERLSAAREATRRAAQTDFSAQNLQTRFESIVWGSG